MKANVGYLSSQLLLILSMQEMGGTSVLSWGSLACLWVGEHGTVGLGMLHWWEKAQWLQQSLVRHCLTFPEAAPAHRAAHVYGWAGQHLLKMEQQPDEWGAPRQGTFLAALEVPRWGCEIWRSVARLFCALSRMVFPISLWAPRTAESSQPLRPPAQLSNCRLPLGRHLLHPK